ncbi:MAG: putative Ig domain-containing protein, partial [Candidatus Pacearchaeota archaeon]|nr:putative Ig domain-containing protein [Candidatus Pacearchaeota archaeon]
GWLSINSATGLISGTAPSVTADENYAVIVSVSDSTDSAIQIFTLVVRETGVIIPDTTPPVINIISPINLANYTSHIISINYTATDANLATCWYSLDNGVTNINVACNSLITGITSVEGSNTWTIYANDTSGNIASQTVTFTVDLPGGNTIPVITSTPITSVNEKAHYSYHVTATDADGNALTYSLVSAPNWLSINSATGLITGTAPSVSSDTTYAITVAVFDGTASVTQSYVLRVYNVSGGNNKGNGAGGETSASDLEFEEQQYLDQFGPRAAISAEDETASTGNILKSKSWLLISLVVLGIILIIALIIFLISLLG